MPCAAILDNNKKSIYSKSGALLNAVSDPYKKNSGSVGNKRIVFVGASYRFVHKVLRDILLVGGFGECELVVHDIDEVPMNIVGDLLQRIVDQTNSKIKIHRTLNLQEALKGADAVILSITTGGEESDTRSWEVCQKYGIPVGIGDTLGPAALARNLRSIPVVVNLIREMERICPDAIMLNFTNPMSALTAAMGRASHIPVFGLCHSGDELFTYFAKVFGCEKSEIKMELGGVNHQSFVTRLWIKGEEVTERILEATEASDAKLEDNLLETKREEVDLQKEIYQCLGAWPSTGDTHLAEFYRFFFTPERIGRFDHMRKIKANRKPYGRNPCPEIIHDWAYGPEPVGDLHLLTTEHAHELLWACFTKDPFTRVLNVLNTGEWIKGIPRDACVEAQVTVSGKQVTGKSIELPTAVHSLVQRWTAIHDLSIRAALECDRDAAKQALFLDPHLKDPRTAGNLLEDMLDVLKPWLPKKWW